MVANWLPRLDLRSFACTSTKSADVTRRTALWTAAHLGTPFQKWMRLGGEGSPPWLIPAISPIREPPHPIVIADSINIYFSRNSNASAPDTDMISAFCNYGVDWCYACHQAYPQFHSPHSANADMEDDHSHLTLIGSLLTPTETLLEHLESCTRTEFQSVLDGNSTTDMEEFIEHRRDFPRCIEGGTPSHSWHTVQWNEGNPVDAR